MRQKLKDQDMFWLEKVKISEVFEFSILPYTENFENSEISESVLLLQILRFTVISDSETTKMNWYKNLKVKICF